MKLCHVRRLCSGLGCWKRPRLTGLDTGDGAAREGTHQGMQMLPSMAVGLHWGIGQVPHGVDGGTPLSTRLCSCSS